MYLAAVLGFFFVVGLSICIPENKHILTIGGGTAVVLGLHSPIQQIIKEIAKFLFHIPTHDYSLFIAIPMTIAVLVFHLPAIDYLSNHFPSLIGKKRGKSVNIQ
jgi:hypothetical protein